MGQQKEQSIFEKIASAPLYGGGLFILPGSYLLAVRDCKPVESKQKIGTTFYIIELEVIETTAEGQGPGDVVSQRIDMSQPSAFSNVKQFCFALGRQLFGDFTEANVDADMVELVFTNWAGFVEKCVESGCLAEGEKPQLKIQANQIQTRKGTPFTKVTWYTTEGEGEGESEEGVA